MTDHILRDTLDGRILSEVQASKLPPERVVREDLTRVRELDAQVDQLTGAHHALKVAYEGAEALLRDAQAALAASIDVAHLDRQRAWSRETFGPSDVRNHVGVLDHLRKELVEVEDAPDDVEEWADVVILAFDGAWRAGHEPADILAAIKAKQAKNEGRTWPDWRVADPNRAIEHVRELDDTEGDDRA